MEIPTHQTTVKLHMCPVAISIACRLRKPELILEHCLLADSVPVELDMIGQGEALHLHTVCTQL